MNKRDRDLLEQYEPILRFSGGKREERFYPIRIEDYLEECTLWQTQRSGRLGAFSPRRIETGWDDLSSGEKRAEALGKNFLGYNYFLRFRSEETAPEGGEPGKKYIGCTIILLASCLGLAWGSAAVGLPWLAGILVFLLLLYTFAVISEWARREFPVGIAQAVEQLLAATIATVFTVSVVTAIAWWLGDAKWGKPALLVSAGFTIGYWILYIALGYGAQLIALVAVSISQVRKKQTDNASVTFQDRSPCYYGRVWSPPEKQSGSEQLVLQYFFFYAFNDWPQHGGLNYHQGDWEAVLVYLEKQDDEAKLEPTHLGLSAHHGGKIWDWEGVEKQIAKDKHSGEEQEHPVVYVAAGSHANYHKEGEKSPSDLLDDQRGLRYRIAEFLDHGWKLAYESVVRLDEGRRGIPGRLGREHEMPTREEPVPAKEYHKGDGRIIGPPDLQIQEQFTSWDCRAVLNERDLDWVEQYKGLWGLKTLAKDLSGPPGPKWNRLEDAKKHRERHYWRDPIGWRDEL